MQYFSVPSQNLLSEKKYLVASPDHWCQTFQSEACHRWVKPRCLRLQALVMQKRSCSEALAEVLQSITSGMRWFMKYHPCWVFHSQLYIWSCGKGFVTVLRTDQSRFSDGWVWVWWMPRELYPQPWSLMEEELKFWGSFTGFGVGCSFPVEMSDHASPNQNIFGNSTICGNSLGKTFFLFQHDCAPANFNDLAQTEPWPQLRRAQSACTAAETRPSGPTFTPDLINALVNDWA